jgi:hypothetical protein
VVKAATKQIAEYNEVAGITGQAAVKKYHDQVDALHRQFDAGLISLELRDRGLANLNKRTDEGTKAVKARIETHREWLAVLRVESTFLDTNARAWAREQAERARMQAAEDRMGAVGGAGGMFDRARSSLSRASAISAQARDEQFMVAAQKARELEQSIGSIDAIFRDSLLGSAQEFSSLLVDAANGADVAWQDWGATVLETMQKAITQAIVLRGLTGSFTGAAGADGKAIGGLFGSLGFASGGTIYPSGSGTTDTQSMMFRKAPSETVHINTPAQEAAYQRGGPSGSGSSTTVRVVSDVDRRRLYSDRDLLVDIGRHRDSIKRLIG